MGSRNFTVIKQKGKEIDYQKVDNYIFTDILLERIYRIVIVCPVYLAIISYLHLGSPRHDTDIADDVEMTESLSIAVT